LTDLPRPDRTYKMKVDGEVKTITMSYGLFNEIMRVVPSPENITDLIIKDPYLRDYVIRRMLTPGRIEKDEDMVDSFDLDIDIEDLDGLVGWVGEHVLHFFMKSGAKMLAVSEKYQETIATLTQSSQSLPGAAN
jgi:hypothetical protein